MEGMPLLPWAPLLTNMSLEIPLKMRQGAGQRVHGPGSKCAERIPGTQKFGVHQKDVEVGFGTASLFEAFENQADPRETFATRCAPAARLLREKLLEVQHEADRTGLIIEHDHRAGAHAASARLYGIEIHLQIEMVACEKRRCPTSELKGR